MRIALYGLGLIGSIWSRNLLADGHRVRGWNRTQKAEHPAWCGDAAEAAREAELAMLVVADPRAVRETLDRILPQLRAGTVVAQHSTIGVADTMEAAQRCRERGLRFLDMPFTGSKPAAEARQTVYYVGDDDAALDAVAGVYRGISKALVPIGRVGQATAIKLCMNLLIAGVNQALAEAFQLAGKAGVGGESFFAALDLNVARSGVSDLKKPKLLAGDWSTQFAVRNMRKDLRLALALAAELGQQLPVTGQVEQAYARAEQLGLGDADYAALIETLRRT